MFEFNISDISHELHNHSDNWSNICAFRVTLCTVNFIWIVALLFTLCFRVFVFHSLSGHWQLIKKQVSSAVQKYQVGLTPTSPSLNSLAVLNSHHWHFSTVCLLSNLNAADHGILHFDEYFRPYDLEGCHQHFHFLSVIRTRACCLACSEFW